MRFKKLFLLILALLFVLSASCTFASAKLDVNNLKAAENTTQIIIVSGTGGSNADFGMYERDNSGKWAKVISSKAYIGKKGFGKTREGDAKTPVGAFHFTKAFGILKDPGCSLGYTQVDNTHYWCGDSNSKYYNQFVSTKDYDDFSKKDSEHIIDYDLAYKYALNISYNEEGTPYRGSAIFLHCQTKNKFTGGCVAVPEKIMIDVMRRVKSDCIIIMDKAKNISKY